LRDREWGITGDVLFDIGELPGAVPARHCQEVNPAWSAGLARPVALVVLLRCAGLGDVVVIVGLVGLDRRVGRTRVGVGNRN
jgi:hypothetical protein